VWQDSSKKSPISKLKVKEVENFFIPLSDGVRLAARMWIPETTSEQNQVPAILEYIPYRKRDIYRWLDDVIQPVLAQYGYALVRVDIRGTGDSDGLFEDEYTLQEHDDAVEVIEWLSRQPWCNGNVGMKGISYGGFNALQVAARRPPALKAIVTQCSTDDRYTDDAHYMGGCLVLDNFIWGVMHLNLMALPPDPELVGDRWREMWMQRLRNSEPVMATRWLCHKTRDDYWKHGSVNEDYSSIACPVYAVSGHSDAYKNVIPRLLENLGVPRKGMIGPWGHMYPDIGFPGPGAGFEKHSLRWWDHWLKGRDTGIMDEPMFRVYFQEQTAAEVFPHNIPGKWVTEETWPATGTELLHYSINADGLGRGNGPQHELTFAPDQSVGLKGGLWIISLFTEDTAADQSEDDAKSLVFDTDPLHEHLDIIGCPEVSQTVSVDRPSAFIFVRLNEVKPDGSSWQISRGLLNLAHRGSNEKTEPVIPGKRYDVKIPLSFAAHRFKAGNKIRLSLSTCYWPMVWPSPEPVVLSVHTGSGYLSLPKRDLGATATPPESLPEPEPYSNVGFTQIRPYSHSQKVHFDKDTGIYEVKVTDISGEHRCHHSNTIVSTTAAQTYRIKSDDPLSATCDLVRTVKLCREDWDVEVTTSARVTATRDDFVVDTELAALDKKCEVFSNRWSHRIPREGI